MTTEPPLDIVVCQALLYKPEFLLAIESHGGRFVDRVRSGDPTWTEWELLGGSIGSNLSERLRGFERNRLLSSIAQVNKLDLALCRRVHNYQIASDLGLKYFWEDIEDQDIRLVERGYSLIATDVGQFVLVFTFRLIGGTPETRGSAVRRLCKHRAIRSNMEQNGFTQLAYSYAQSEIERLFRSMRIRIPGEMEESSVLATPSIHGPVSWITNKYDLTAFPWFMSGRLSSEIDNIFSASNDLQSISRRYEHPSIGDFKIFHGNDFGIICDTETGANAVRYEILPLLIYAQFSYYKVRQLQGQLIHWMSHDIHCTKTIKLEYHTERFERLSHSLYRFLLATRLFVDSCSPRMRMIADRMTQDWRMNSAIEILVASVDRHRDQLSAIGSEISRRDAKRQESVIFVIAMLQILALVSVLADYRQLNPLVGTSSPVGTFAFEQWLIAAAPWLLRVFVVIAALLVLWRFWRTAWKHLRWCGKVASWPRFVIRSTSQKIGRRLEDPTIDYTCVRVDRSEVHGRGLFAMRAFVAGDIIFSFPEGVPIDVGGDKDMSGSHWEREWNAVEGKLYVREGVGTAYRLINHSRDPNVVVIHKPIERAFVVQAICDIYQNNELLLDYRQETLPRMYLVQRGGYL